MKKFFIILFLYQLHIQVCLGQVINTPFVIDSVAVSSLFIHLDSTKQQKIEEIAITNFQPNKKIIVAPLTKPYCDFWLHFQLTNTSKNNFHRILELKNEEIIELYTLKENKLISFKEGGRLTSDRNRTPPSPDAFSINIPPEESYDYYIKISYPVSLTTKSDTLEFTPTLLTLEREHIERLNKQDQGLNYYVFNIAFLAISFFTALFSFIHWIYNKDNSYLYYAGYTLAIFLYFLRKLEIYYFGNNLIFAYIPKWYYFVEIVISMFIYSMYTLFIQAFLDMKNTNVKLHKIALKISKGMLLFVLFALTLLIFVNQQAAYLSFFFIRVILAVGGFVYIYHVVKENQILHRIILAGTAFLMLVSLSGMVMAMCRSSALAVHKTLTQEPLFYSQIGFVGELLIFSVGLAYKTNLLHIAKLNSERKALAARMKPHFISNGLNSIKSLIIEGKKKEARSYLSKFAALLRNIINFSTEDLISLKQELEWSKNYMEIEELRFEGEFTFELKIDPAIDLTAIKIPPLVLQPHLENAVNHGLRSVSNETWDNLEVKRAGKQLNLRVVFVEEAIICIIEDNGIGRKKATERKQAIQKKHTSIGISTTKARLEQVGMTQNIVDKVNEQGQALGTRIEIIIPYQKQ